MTATGNPRMTESSLGDQFLANLNGPQSKRSIETRPIGVPQNWRELEYHPLSDLVEFGAGIDLDGLRKHIRENGYDPDEPIILYSGKILDGRHKHAAARAEKATPTFREFTGGSPEAYVAKKAFRQHLNESQRAMLAVQMADRFANLQNATGEKTKTSVADRAKAASTMNVSPRSAESAEKVKEKGTEELKEAVNKGSVTVSDAAKVADEPAKVQRQAVKDVKAGKAKTVIAAAKPKAERKPRQKAERPSDIPEIDWHLMESHVEALRDVLDTLCPGSKQKRDCEKDLESFEAHVAKLYKKVAKKDPPKTDKKARARNPLFDAIAEVTATDPNVSASHVGKICAALNKADPPYTPEEVHEFARLVPKEFPWFKGRITLGMIEKYIGVVRADQKTRKDQYSGLREFLERNKNG